MKTRDDFFIYSPNMGRVQSACNYYRIEVPLRGLEKLYGVKTFVDTGGSVEDSIKGALSADIDLFYSMVGTDTLHKVNVIREMKPGIIGDGTFHYPPSIVWDTDDNTDFVHPINTSFCSLGVRAYPSLEILKPQEQLEILDAEDKKIKVWEDMVTYQDGVVFDIARNLFNMKVRHEIIRAVHGVTTTNPVLADYIKRVIKQKNVYVFPNTVIPEDYPSFPLIPTDEIKILWQGSMSHYIDWYSLRDAIREIATKYPKVKWVMYGEKFDWVTDIIPPEQIEHIHWTPYPAYKIRRGLIQAAINLCPLADNIFNNCKSAIKWYEGSVWERPEATLAQNVKPYSLEMTDGENGLLFSTPQEFVEKLSLLIENEELRKKLGTNAKKWVLANRTPEKTIPGLMEFYEECREIRKREAVSA